MKRVLLSIFLMTPILAVASLMYLFALDVNNPDKQIAHVPAVGAGAGETGGANALGEMLAGRTATGEERAPAVLAAASGTAESHEAAAQPATPANANMVKPESLEQGFIIIVEDRAKLASLASPIYIAGSFNAWNAGDLNYRLTPQSDMKWRIEFPRWTGGSEFNFKFTRGSWELEELQADLTPPVNRRLPLIDKSKLAPGEKPRLEFVVERWGDERPEFKKQSLNDPYRELEITGTYRRLQVAGAPSFTPRNAQNAPGAAANSLVTPVGAQRELIVWLPEGYEQGAASGKKYPVLLLMDGQNLFEKNALIPDEWHVDETATEIIRAGRSEPFIIVGIPHAGEARLSEYLPIKISGGPLAGVTPRGDEFVNWLSDEVLPRLRRSFAIDSDPSRVAIGGSSMGAVIALHAATRRPDLFGSVLLESYAFNPSMRDSLNAYFDAIGAPGSTSANAWPRRVYLGVGTKELADQAEDADANKAYAAATRDLAARLRKAGLSEANLKVVVDPGAVHNESAWAKRFGPAAEFLFPAKR